MSGFGITSTRYWHFIWAAYFNATGINFGRFPVQDWPMLSPLTYMIEPNPLRQADWDALEWDTSVREDVIPKPTWAEVLAPFAALHRAKMDTYLEKLHRAYEYQVRRHLPTLYHREDIGPFIELLKRTGRGDDAVNAAHWSDFLFFRYLEMKHALLNGNDEVIVGMVECHVDNTRGYGPWDYDVTWTGPTFSFHPTLPPYRKGDAVLASIPTVPPPPSGVTVERRGPSTLVVTASAPAIVSMSHPRGFYELTFNHAGDQVVSVAPPDPPTEETVQVSWTAYGEENTAAIAVEAA